MSDAIIMNLRYTPLKHIAMRRGVMQIVVVLLISLAQWLIIQVNGTGHSVNMIHHKRLAFRRQTFIEPLLYINISICFWNICSS